MKIREVVQPEIGEEYADIRRLKTIANSMSGELPDAKFTATNAGGSKEVPHIRAQKLSSAELTSIAGRLGLTPASPTRPQMTASNKHNVFAFKDKDGLLYTAVIGSVGKGDDSSIGISRKELTPTNLGLAGKTLAKDEIITLTKQAITKKVRDIGLQQALLGLIDIAASGGKDTLPPELAEKIKDGSTLGTISQDFGEILAPLLIMDDSEKAEFPAGNNPIVDVKVGKMNISVKALTGSGTSFATVQDLMDRYEQSLTDNDSKRERFNILKQFHPSTGGKNVDKIIRAAAHAQIPEYQTLCQILGVKQLTSFNELYSATAKISNKSYGEFLKTIYPAMTAGGWSKPTGLPADGAYYMGSSTKAPAKTKTAGKGSYDRDPTGGGANILTYALGVGLLNKIKKGDDAEEYRAMMTDIVKEADAVIGHITINSNGSMHLDYRPFADLNFEFQYHAPSHIPGNNLPGFIAVLN